MAAEEAVSLESLLNKATNPACRDEDWDAIMAFCDRVNKELEGPQISVRLLAHKIQSPQEREALYALTTLESCVKNCGKRFHQEIGKFRFLNEMIKVVSPKYLGAHTTEKVKKKCIEIMYSWTLGLKHESKIVEAYSMLKRQGIVKEDPTYVEQDDSSHSKTYEPPRDPDERKATFEDEEKSKLLARLLKSKNPEDLQAANRLIKNMVKQDAERMEKVSRRVTELETVGNNIKLLAEMLQHYSASSSSEGERDLMKELYDNLEKERPKLFRLASDTDEKDAEGINEILRVNDSVLKIMIEYKKVVEGISEENGIGTLTSSPSKGNTSSLVDLELGISSAPSSQPNAPAGQQSSSSSIVDDQLLSLGLPATNGETNAAGQGSNMDALGDLFGATPATNANKENLLDSLLGGTTTTTADMPGYAGGTGAIGGANPAVGVNFSQPSNIPPLAAPPPGNTSAPLLNVQQQQQPGLTTILPVPAPSLVTGILPQQGIAAVPAPVATQSAEHPMTQQQKSALDDLDKLGQSLLQQSLPLEQTAQPSFPVQQTATKVPMNQMPKQPLMPGNAQAASSVPLKNLTATGGQALESTPTASPKKTPKTVVEVQPLTDVFVPLETVKPGTVQPLNVYDKNGIKVVLHFGKDSPRPDVLVMVVSIMSTNESPVTKCTFQAAVPKMMKVKLQPPSATDLPAYNPILPPTAITQVMLIANPHKERIRLKFKLTYNTNDGPQSDVGEEDNFPVQ